MKKLLSLVAVLLVATGMALGQSQNGSIAGVITDTTGAVVPGATITVTSINTGGVRTTTTTSSGAYDIEGLPPQEYTVTVTAPGFAVTTTAKFTVAVGSSNTVNAKVSVKSEGAVVNVAANSLAGINLENAEQSTVIDQVEITELPSISRNPYDFVQASGSVSADPSAASRGVGVNIAGARSASTEILLDGIENTQLFAVNVATSVPVDAVQEYRIITSNYGPEYGRASGGVVNVVTKAGTNSFHGDAWEFYRPSTFASNSYNNNAYAIQQGRFVRNEFGFVVGGPVIKDKLFFFGGNEWLRVRSSNTAQFYIPTSQFLAASNANTQAYFAKFGTVTGTPSGAPVTLGQIGGGANAISSSFSTDRTYLEATQPTVFNDNFPVLQLVNVKVFADAGGGLPQNTYNSIGRLDFNLSNRTQMYGRYVLFNEAGPLGTGNVSPYAGFTTAFNQKTQNLVYGITHNFSDKFTSQVQLGLLRSNVNNPLGTQPESPTLYVNSGAAPSVGNFPLVFPGYSETNAGNGLPSGGPQNNIVVSPVFTYTKGRHTFNFGGQYTYIRDNHTFAIYYNPQESLVSAGTTDTYVNAGGTKVTVGALSNFNNGVFDFFQANIDPQGKFPCPKNLATGTNIVSAGCTVTTPVSSPVFGRSNRYQESAYFFNDSFKASPRLTLNVGLRYELYGTQHNKNSNLDNNFYLGTSGTLADQIRAGQFLNVNQAAPAGVRSPNGKLWNTNYKQFAPRIAFAYDVTGDGKTSVRGGYGISYERNFGNVTYNVALNPPSQFAISITQNDNGGNQFSITPQTLGPFASVAGIQKSLPQASARAVDSHIKPAYNQFYTLALERQVNQTFAATLAYTGERGIHNYSIANYNRSYYGPIYENDPYYYAGTATRDANRLNPYTTGVNIRGADGDSYYNGLNLGLRGSNLYHTGMTLQFNYTYAHSLDNTSSTFSDGQANSDVGGVAYFDPFNHAIDHGNSDFDVRHRVSIGLVYLVPDFHTSGFVKRIVGGFEVNSIYSAATGTPASEYDCGIAHVTACARVRFTSPQPHKSNGTIQNNTQPNFFQYITFPKYPGPGYGSYVDPKEGYADLPTIVNGIDTFPGGMTARNAFYGPGTQSWNADVVKNVVITEHIKLQLRAELYNVLNHANTYLNLSGANDVSNTNFLSASKSGQRQLQLAGKIVF